MAWCPFAEHKPINKSRSAIAPRAIIAHTAVSDSASLYDYFSRVGDDSHFYIDRGGRIEQYVDTVRSAYANRNANSFAVSIETWDGRDPANIPWTAQQVASLITLNNWLAETHGAIPRRQIDDPYGSGIGWHAMFGAPSPWTSAPGKTCPGAPRIAQMRETIIPAFIHNWPADPNISNQEDLVQLRAGRDRSASISLPRNATELNISIAYDNLVVHQLDFWGPYGKAGEQNGLGGYGETVVTDHYPWIVPVPSGALAVSIRWTLENDMHEGSVIAR